MKSAPGLLRGIFRAHMLRRVWLLLAILPAGVFAQHQALCKLVTEPGYAEPPRPCALPQVRELLDPTTLNPLLNEKGFNQALERAEQARQVAVAAGDQNSEALALEVRAHIQGVQARLLKRPEKNKEAAESRLEAGKIWDRLGYLPGRILARAYAATNLLSEDPPRGQELREQALQLGREPTDWPLATAEALHMAGNSMRAWSRWKEAQEFYEAALEIQQRVAPDSMGMARTLHSLGHVARYYANRAGAGEEYFQSALAIQQRLEPDAVDTAKTLRSLSVCASERGDLAQGLQFNLREVQILEKLKAEYLYDYGTALHNAGVFHRLLGDFPSAEQYAARAVESWVQHNPNPMRHAVFIGSLGEALFEQGRTAEAEEQFRRSLQQAERITEGRPSLTAAQTLESLARVFRRKGQFSEARAQAQRAVEILEGMPRAPLGLAYALRTLALVARDLGEWDLAEKSLLRALELEEKYYGAGDNPSKLPGLAGLAEVFAFQGERQKALDLALRAERASSEFARLTARSLSEREALLFSATRTSAAGIVLTLATSPAAQSAWKLLAWDSLIHSRALVLDEMAARHLSVGATEDADELVLRQKVREAREGLARIWVRGPREEPEKYQKFLAQAQAEKDAAERALAAKSQTARAELARAAIGWEQVLSALPARSALVGFARYPHLNFSAGATAKPPEPVPSYVAFVLRSRETTPETIPLGAAKEIEELIAQMRQQMAREARSQGRSARRNEAQFRAVAAHLRRLLWDPLVPHLRGASRVFLVPDGALHLVDFAALPAGKQSYLIEIGPQIHYLSAERDLVSTEMPPEGKGILVVGDPAFDDAAALAGAPHVTLAQGGASSSGAQTAFRGMRSACGAFASLRFEPLRASAREAEEVLRVWSGENAAAGGFQLRGAPPAGASGSVLLRGAAASEAEFKRLAVGRRVLHLATHGFFLGSACESALAAEAGPMERLGVAAGGENPLLHSGLALAGANRRRTAGAEDEDGILTAEEIAALDLRGTEWAVLSACDTGLGEVQAGEGVLGLRRAFQMAGVRTVIMSLWPVEDEAARQWMRRLYSARFVKNKTTAEAAQQASLEILRQRRVRQQSTHPFYWAGFVAAGDWR